MNKWTLEIERAWEEKEKSGLYTYSWIDNQKNYELAEKHAFDEWEIPAWQYDGVYPKRHWAFAAYQLWVNCTNFDFNIHEIPDTKYMVADPFNPQKPFRGAFAMGRSWYRSLGETIPHAKDILERFRTATRTEIFFRGINDIPNPERRSACVRDFAFGLEKWYDSNPLNLLEDSMVYDTLLRRSVIRAFNGGKGLVELLVEKFPVAYGADVQELDGQKLKFYKRAQLVAILLHGRALASGRILPSVADIDEVGPIADYEVPRAQRAKGVLQHSAYMASFVDNWKPLENGDAPEVHTRAASVTAVLRHMRRVNEIRSSKYLHPINISHSDFYWWSMGRENKTLRPMLVRTSNY